MLKCKFRKQTEVNGEGEKEVGEIPFGYMDFEGPQGRHSSIQAMVSNRMLAERV